MFNHSFVSKLFWMGLISMLLLVACTAQPSPLPTSSPTALPLPSPTSTVPPSPSPKPTLAPTPVPRTLTICMGAEPESLYFYGSSMLAQSNILAAIYDGPIDNNSFSYQPVILEKLPSLADGDAVLQPISVEKDDLIVNDTGDTVLLHVGQVVRPFGCNDSSCAITWDGSPLEMGQLSSTFKLLQGLKWSDGTPLTAHDSVFGFEVASSTYTPYTKDTIHHTASYTALDERTVQWVGRPGFLDPNYQINFFHPLPKHQLGKYSPAELLLEPEAIRSPLSWGPYMIQKWTPGEKVTMLRNPYYFRASDGLPYFDALTFKFVIQDADYILAAIKNGECDVVDQEASMKTWATSTDKPDLQELLDLDAAGQLHVDIATGTTWEHLDFNIRSLADTGFASLDSDGDGVGPFGDVRLRQAIAMCIDRQSATDAVYLGQSVVLNTYLSPSHPLYNPDVHIWTYDPMKADALLDEIGWQDADNDPAAPRTAVNVPGVPDGAFLEFNLETTTATQRQLVTGMIAEDLAQCGIRVNLIYHQAADWFADPPAGILFGRLFDLGQFAWLTGSIPHCELWMSDQIPGPEDQINPATGENYLGWQGQNNTGYSNPEFDAACRSALSALPGTAEFTEYHHLAQAIFADDLPVIPLYLRIKFTVTRPDMCGHVLDSTAYTDFWNIEEYDYGEHCP